MRHQITILAVAGLVPNALAQSTTSMDMSMPMSMPMSMSNMPMSTSTISIPCLVAGFSLLGDGLPAPSDAALGSFIGAATSVNSARLATDACGVATSLAAALPSSLRGPAASYQTALAGFVSANANNISSVYAECGALPPTTTVSGVGFSPANITDAVNLVTAFADTGCVKDLAGATGTAAGEGEGEGSSSRNAARPTGVAVGAVAAVGFMGAVALL